MPPIPGGLSSPTMTRPPPPPPPHAEPIRQEDDDSDDEEVTEYEADYDTDIANKAPHRDALTAQHSKDKHSAEDDDTPLPSPTAPRAVPPPIPMSPPSLPRASIDQPRMAPPPPPVPAAPQSEADDEEYDPFRHPPAMHNAPPPPPPAAAAPSFPPAPSSRGHASKASLDIRRGSVDLARGRRSMDTARPHADYIARDIDLCEGEQWWLKPSGLPSSLSSKLKDIRYEIDDSATGRSVYVLFHDYSQTVITVQDGQLEQRHEPPPTAPRQDQLEDYAASYGQKIFGGMKSREGTIVGDGEPASLIKELFTLVPGALPPVGTRAYGALVYANLGNASIQQNDEIRPGDVVTFRNARFQGHKGGLHQKYNVEVKEHVAVVVDWDGIKKKIRGWEQGRDGRKVKVEGYKVGDLRSGEVKVWRVVGREWVGWE